MLRTHYWSQGCLSAVIVYFHFLNHLLHQSICSNALLSSSSSSTSAITKIPLLRLRSRTLLPQQLYLHLPQAAVTLAVVVTEDKNLLRKNHLLSGRTLATAAAAVDLFARSDVGRLKQDFRLTSCHPH